VAQNGSDVVILGGARTPMAEYAGGKTGAGAPGGAFKDISAIELGAIAARAALERTGVDPGEIDHTIMGNAMQTSGDACYGARHVALKAGVPIEKPAVTINRLCGSGIESVVQASHLIRLGEATAVLAGGMENMTQAPHVIRGLRGGLRLGEGQLEDSLMVGLRDTYCGLYMANTAEKLAREVGVTREEMDRYALRSFQSAGAASAAGKHAEEIVPVPIKRGRDTVEFKEDDHYKPDTTLEVLAKLRPAFDPNGFVTAGNASGIVDGAAAVVVTSRANADAHGWKPLARIVSSASVGVDPSTMGIGPVPAIQEALKRAELTLDDMDLIEVNEAFAAQYLAVEKVLGLPREKTNVNGGAIAIGHPLAATGTRLLLTIMLELKRRGGRYGVVSACIGGGQGIAMVVENLQRGNGAKT
jgi:acetyl-CoA acetyltransferase family protein